MSDALIPVFGEMIETLREASSTEILASLLVLTWLFMPMYYHDRIRRIRRRKDFYKNWATGESDDE